MDFGKVLYLVSSLPRTCRVTMCFLFLAFAALLQNSGASNELCLLLEAATGPDVNLNDCGVNNISYNDMKKVVNVTKLYLEYNDFRILDPKVFSDNKKLSYVYLGNNANLIVPEDGCFLESDSIRYLDLSHTRVCTIKPSSLKCMPNLSHLMLVGVPTCRESLNLSKESNSSYKVICGGDGFDYVTHPNSTLCLRHLHDTSSPEPDTSTDNSQQPSTAPEKSNTTPEVKVTTDSSDHRSHSPGNTDQEEHEFSSGYIVLIVIVCLIVGLGVVFLVLYLISRFCDSGWLWLINHCPLLQRLESCFKCDRQENENRERENKTEQ